MKKLIFTFISLFFAFYISADPVSPEIAKVVAGNFFQGKNLLRSGINPEPVIIHTDNKDSDVYFYILEVPGRQGWLILAGDDDITPVIAYSDEGTLKSDIKNENFEYWMNYLKSEMDVILNKNKIGLRSATQNNKVKKEWKELLDPSGVVTLRSTTSIISPLLENITWNQTGANAYAKDTPGNLYVGCVAVVLGEIMKAQIKTGIVQGVGSHSYIPDGFGYELSVNFAANPYNFSLMPDKIIGGTTPSNQIDQLAKFLYHLGVACDMDYNSLGSSSKEVYAMKAMYKHFNYESPIYTSREHFSNAAWSALILSELETGRPVFYGGVSPNRGGHAFVVDGYDGTDFHFNWGWGGYGDGYYKLSLDDPGYSISSPRVDFKDDQSLLYGFKPNRSGQGEVYASGFGPIVGKNSDDQSFGNFVTYLDAGTSISIPDFQIYNNSGNLISNANVSLYLKRKGSNSYSISQIANSINIPNGGHANVSGLKKNVSDLGVVGDYEYWICIESANMERGIYYGNEYIQVKPGPAPFIPVPVTSVNLNKSTAVLTLGETLNLLVTFNPVNATNKNVTWSSSNTSVATVDAVGNVVSKAVGSTIITVTTIDGNKTDICNVTVNPKYVTGVTLAPASAVLFVDDHLHLAADVQPSDATNKNVVWTSSDNLIATVVDGEVVAKSAGTVMILVATIDGNKTASCLLTIYPKIIHVSGVSVSQENAFLEIGGQLRLLAGIIPLDATTKDVSWSSDNPTVATVDADGLVIARSIGIATISVKTVDGNKSDFCVVNVTPKMIRVDGVTLNHSSIELSIGEMFQLITKIEPLDATNKEVSWSSSNSYIATVDSDGKITTKSTGKAIITATTIDGNKTAICEVIVKDFILITYNEIQPVGKDGNGRFTINFSRIVNASIDGSFKIQFPKGMELDEQLTCLSSELSEKMKLNIQRENESTWLFEITAKSLDDISVVPYKEIVDIRYKVNEDVENGMHQIQLNNINLNQSNGNPILQKKATISVDIARSGSDINDINYSMIKVYVKGNALLIDSNNSEIVEIFTIGGLKLFSGQKESGEMIVNVSNLPAGVLIVKGSSGWVRKVIK